MPTPARREISAIDSGASAGECGPGGRENLVAVARRRRAGQAIEALEGAFDVPK